MDPYANQSINALVDALEERLSMLSPDGLTLEGRGSEALGAWFLGPKAENETLFKALVCSAIADHAASRRAFVEKDPPWITDKVKESEVYQKSVDRLATEFRKLLTDLDGSIPFFSYRYQGHMLWDLTLPGMLGYFAAMLWNQNNVAAEASPVTTWLEMLVGDDLCRMLGYYVPKREQDRTSGRIRYEMQKNEEDDQADKKGKKIGAWGHITCDGSVANIEAMWAARNLKFYPLAVAEALRCEPVLAPARGLLVPLPNGGERPLVQLNTWELLNLKGNDTLALAERIENEYGVSKEAIKAIAPYTLQELGFREFGLRFPAAAAGSLVVLGPATMHYSWPRGTSVLGLGSKNLIRVPVDLDARMSLPDLRIELDRCLADRRPVVMVVAVVGSTEESAVDPLRDVLELREEYREAGLEFIVHVDAAWGGYFASMLRPPMNFPPQPILPPSDGFTLLDTLLEQKAPEIALSGYVAKQYGALKAADSITVDPHKAGFIPYPAGGLCYRNSAMRNLVAFTAPVIYHGTVDPTVGIFGIEGSKPGAAAAATYLSHRVIRPDRSGYGRILGRCMFNSKRLYAALVTMADVGDPFTVVAFQRLPAEREYWTKTEVEDQRRFIRDHIVGRTNEELLADDEAMRLFRELGSDQIIIAYAFNFKQTDGSLNQDVGLLNQLNHAIFERLSVLKWVTGKRKPLLFVTGSSFDPKLYGRDLVGNFMERLGVVGDPTTPIEFLISTTLDPWLTDTAEGNFIPTLVDVLKSVVHEEVAKVQN